jgi:DNA adenine methylase Dam
LRDKTVAKNKLVAPVVKWVGGKRQILDEITKYVPKTFSTYYEPFLGGGAVLFELQPKKAVVNDINAELMNIYVVIKENVEELIDELKQHKNERLLSVLSTMSISRKNTMLKSGWMTRCCPGRGR